jgi:hypothetical protein
LSPAPGGRRPIEPRGDAPVQQVLEQLAVAGDEIGDQADEHDLEADDHQHRREDQRLQVPEALNVR